MSNLNITGNLNIAGGGNLQGSPLVALVESGDGYLRYSDGTQICYGDIQVSGTAASFQTRTLPKAFINANYKLFLNYNDTTSTTTISYRAVAYIDRTTTTFRSFNAHNHDFLAIGKWK